MYVYYIKEFFGAASASSLSSKLSIFEVDSDVEARIPAWPWSRPLEDLTFDRQRIDEW